MTALLDAPDREHVLAGMALEPVAGSCPACGRQLERAENGDPRGLCRVHGYPSAAVCGDAACPACPRAGGARCGVCGELGAAHRDGDGQPVPACAWHAVTGL